MKTYREFVDMSKRYGRSLYANEDDDGDPMPQAIMETAAGEVVMVAIDPPLMTPELKPRLVETIAAQAKEAGAQQVAWFLPAFSLKLEPGEAIPEDFSTHPNAEESFQVMCVDAERIEHYGAKISRNPTRMGVWNEDEDGNERQRIMEVGGLFSTIQEALR